MARAIVVTFCRSERIVAGLEKKNRLLNPHKRRVVARHELGYVLVALLLPRTDAVHKVSILPRGIGALGDPSHREVIRRHRIGRLAQ